MDTIYCKGYSEEEVQAPEFEKVLATAHYLNSRRDAFHLTGMEGLSLDKAAEDDDLNNKDMECLRLLHNQFGYLVP
jgi:hypothetical protein